MESFRSLTKIIYLIQKSSKKKRKRKLKTKSKDKILMDCINFNLDESG